MVVIAREKNTEVEERANHLSKETRTVKALNRMEEAFYLYGTQ